MEEESDKISQIKSKEFKEVEYFYSQLSFTVPE